MCLLAEDSPKNLKCKLVITVYIVLEFHSTGHKIMQVNDFFLLNASALSDKLDWAIISAINYLMNHECIKDLSTKISIEFKDQVSNFLSKGFSES